jgi:membrane fusion protein (multidrug efflux system)
MQLPDLFSKISKDKIPFIIGGVFVGALALWVFGKVLTPWVRPVIKDACLTILELKQDRNGAGERVVDIEAIRVSLATMSKRIVTVGKLRANEEVMLRSEMAGRISEITFTEGEAVNKGDVLIQFENSDLIAEVNLAEAELIRAKADHERITKLRSQNIESIKKFDETKATLAIAQSKLEKAQSQLEKSTIIAPFSGNIGLIDISVGAYVQAAQDIVKLVDNTPIKIDFKVPEQNVHDVGVGQTAEIKLDGFPDELIMATVASVDASLDTVSHSLSLRATTPNENGQLRAGMFANISLIVGEKGNTIVVPESAVTRDGEREFVWIVKNGKAGRRRVITGTREKGKVEIIQGLRVDELVVIAGQIKLGEGTNVNITNLESIEAALKEEGETTKETPKAPETPVPVAAPTEEIQEPKTEDKSKVQKALDSIKNLFSKNKE